ncbi:unnamed protein product, partial [Musa acuminata subsp. malaccensis]
GYSIVLSINIIALDGRSDGSIVDYDIRKDDRAICDYRGHRLEVCSLKWSELFGRYLASGGKDKLVHIWDTRMAVANHHPRQHQLLHKISNHTSLCEGPLIGALLGAICFRFGGGAMIIALSFGMLC